MTATLYAGTPLGIFKSTDGGANWSPMNTGLVVSGGVNAIAIDPASATERERDC